MSHWSINCKIYFLFIKCLLLKFWMTKSLYKIKTILPLYQMTWLFGSCKNNYEINWGSQTCWNASGKCSFSFHKFTYTQNWNVSIFCVLFYLIHQPTSFSSSIYVPNGLSFVFGEACCCHFCVIDDIFYMKFYH